MWYWIVVYKAWIKRKYTVQDYWTSVCGILSNASEKFCETKQVCQERGSNLRQAVYVEPSHQVSLSQPSVDSLVVAVSSVSLVWSTKRLAVFSKFSSRMWSVMLWHTPSTPRERLWQPWMWCTLWRDRVALYTALAVRRTLRYTNKRLLWEPPNLIKVVTNKMIEIID